MLVICTTLTTQEVKILQAFLGIALEEYEHEGDPDDEIVILKSVCEKLKIKPDYTF